MTKVIAAVDNSPAARAVLATAGNLAELFDAEELEGDQLGIGETFERIAEYVER